MPPKDDNLDWVRRLQDLRAAAEQLELAIECVDLSDPEFPIQSGYCRVNGRQVIFLDENLSPQAQARFLLQVLSRFDLERIYVAAWIRERLDPVETLPAES
ncbi:MAG: hypothetical protein ACE5ER_12800 [Nitrospinaceae bacterium]